MYKYIKAKGYNIVCLFIFWERVNAAWEVYLIFLKGVGLFIATFNNFFRKIDALI